MPYVVAGLLASLTVRVFFELQDYGPESAIRRFLEAIKKNNPAELDDVITEKAIHGDDEKEMIARIGIWQQKGVTMQVGRMERNINEVRAVVIFSFPNETIFGPVWVVERRGKDWLVDANKTAINFWDDYPPK